MDNSLINPEDNEIVSYEPIGKVLSLHENMPGLDYHKTLGDIFRCIDISKTIKNIKRGFEYVVQIPEKYRKGYEEGQYTILESKNGEQWATLYEVTPDNKHRFKCNLPIKKEEMIKGNPIHDVSVNMQMMAMQQQLSQLTETVKEVLETVQRIERGQTDDRIGKLRAGREGIEQAILLEDASQRKFAFSNAQQLILEARGQIGETLQTKVKDFPAIPKSQVKQFIARLISSDYLTGKDKAFDSIQEYFQLYLLSTRLLAESYYYCGEAKAAEKAYQDAVDLIRTLDFSKVKTLHNIHPHEDFSDSICELAEPYVLSEQEECRELAKSYDSIELLISGDYLMEVLADGEA